MDFDLRDSRIIGRLIIIGLLALIMRVAMGEVLRLVPHDGALTDSYFQYANNLLDHHLFSCDMAGPGVPDSFRCPGYPVFLAAIRLLSGSAQWKNWVATVQYCLGALSCVWVALLAMQMYGARTGLLAGLIAAFYLDFIYISVPFLREILGIFLLLAMLNAFVWFLRTKRIGWLAASAVVYGIGLLTRPEITFVGFFLFLLYRREITASLRLRQALLIGLAAFLPWSLWIARNYRVQHQFLAFSTEGAWAFFMGQAFAPDHAVPDGDIRAMQIMKETPQEMAWYRRMISEGRQAMLTHPVRALYWVIPKLRITFQEYAGHRMGLFLPLLAVLIPWQGFRGRKRRWAFTLAGGLVAAFLLVYSDWDRTAPFYLLHVSYTETVVLAAFGFPAMIRDQTRSCWKVLAASFLTLIVCNALGTSHVRQRVVLGDWVLMIWAAYAIDRCIIWLQSLPQTGILVGFGPAEIK